MCDVCIDGLCVCDVRELWSVYGTNGVCLLKCVVCMCGVSDVCISECMLCVVGAYEL